jgi:hypothetical protein
MAMAQPSQPNLETESYPIAKRQKTDSAYVKTLRSTMRQEVVKSKVDHSKSATPVSEVQEVPAAPKETNKGRGRKPALKLGVIPVGKEGEYPGAYIFYDLILVWLTRIYYQLSQPISNTNFRS